jgi:hypothetical protein
MITRPSRKPDGFPPGTCLVWARDPAVSLRSTAGYNLWFPPGTCVIEAPTTAIRALDNGKGAVHAIHRGRRLGAAPRSPPQPVCLDCSRRGLFPERIVPGGVCSRRGLFPERIVPGEGCSRRGLFPERVVPGEGCSRRGLFPERVVPGEGCSRRGLFPERVVPGGVCSRREQRL